MVNKKAQMINIPISEEDLEDSSMGDLMEGLTKVPMPGDSFIIEDDEGYDNLEDFEDSDSANVNIDTDEVTFNINVIPGAPEDVVLDDDDDDDGEEAGVEEEIIEEINSWDWEKSHGTGKFLKWLKSMIEGIPSHSGSDTTGVERAIAYFEKLNVEISKAMRRDFKREIDASKAEEARSMIEDGLKRLNERLEKLRTKKFKKAKKKADQEHDGLVKNAETSFTGRIQVNVPYFISFIARACIETSVQAGKDMAETFTKLGTEYKLDKREKVQVIQLIKDMGYPIVMDRLRINEGKLDLTDTDGEFLSQYPA